LPREIIFTKDGSHSLIHTELNETYHSIHGAVQESKYVFIEKGLEFWLSLNNNHDATILEIGFGTGLNALLTLQKSVQRQTKVYYATLEAFPLPKEIWTRLNYPESLDDKELFEQLHSLPWDSEQAVTATFLLKKYYTTLQAVTLLPNSFDVVYYDAFAPSKQPEMWSMDMLEKVSTSLRQGGVFVTYCARGQLKRDLKDLNFVVETLPGPPGKKEMVRAVKA
jgi:tRNA U34 5-methylaminomethyl-2-thiouridine-forming methyltransferase MnmC